MYKRFSVLWAFLLFVFACNTSRKLARNAPVKQVQVEVRYSPVEKSEAERIYRRFLSAVNPSGKILPGTIEMRGTYIDGRQKIPVRFSVQKDRSLSVSLYFGGRLYYPVRYENGRITLLDNRPYTEQKTRLAREIAKFTADPLSGILGYYVRGNFPFKRTGIRKINGVDVDNLTVQDGRYEWRFYFDKKTGYPVKWEKYDENGMLFALEFMDFRIENGFWLSHHMIATDKNHKKTTYIWKKYIIR